jgi:hypothetical protein
VRRIADAMRVICADGTVPDAKAVQTITGQAPRTIDKHWDAAVALVAAKQIVQAILTVPEEVSVAPTFGSSVWGYLRKTAQQNSQSAIRSPVRRSPDRR